MGAGKGKDAQIGPVIDNRFDDLMRVQKRKTDFRLRVTRVELLRVEAHVLQSHGIDHRHAYSAPERFTLLCDFRLDLLVVLE